MIRSPFGEAIRKKRKEMKMSQADLGGVTGIHPGYIARIESDGSVPGVEKIHILAEVLEIPENKLQKLGALTNGNLDVLSNYPNLMEILQRAVFSMTDGEAKDTLQRIDQRIALFREDKDALASNVKMSFLGELALHEKPQNGLRPLSHYVVQWSREVDEW